MFKFTLTIATSVALLMSGVADLFAMEPLEDESKALTINHIPKEIIGLTLEEASKNVNPRRLVSVCKSWYNIIRENKSLQGAALRYLAMNPFMQKCMNTYWENQFYNGTLRYTPTDGSPAVVLKFLDLKEDGTFNLSACGDTGQYLVITENMNRFGKTREENADKMVIAIMLRHKIQQEIKNLPDHPFTSLMGSWDADKAPVGIFWRWGNDTGLSRVDYLITEGMAKISSTNLFENWRWVEDGWRDERAIFTPDHRRDVALLGPPELLSCQFLNRNKDDCH